MADKLYKTRQQEINKRTGESEGTTEDTQCRAAEKSQWKYRESTELEQESRESRRVTENTVMPPFIQKLLSLEKPFRVFRVFH